MGEIGTTDQSDGGGVAGLPTVTVCRGCCCGTVEKHPGADHEGQLRQLRASVVHESQVRVVRECLGHCDRSNVMVVAPSRLGRLFGGRPTWLGHVLDETSVSAVAEWLNSAGPGLVPVPDAVRDAQFVPPRQSTR